MKFKKLTAIMLSTALLLTFTACSSTENNPSDTGTPTQGSSANTDGTAGGEGTPAETDGNEPSQGSLATIAEEAPPTNVPDLNDYSYADGAADSEYVIDNGITDRMIALSELNLGNTVRLANAMKKAANGEEITVSFIGGSITQGSSAGDNDCYAKLVYDWFGSTFPNAKVNYNRAGIGATGSYIGVHRVERDVLSNNPDVVFVEFSVNDTTENTRRDVDSYDSLLRKIWGSDSKPAIVCIGMTQENGTSVQNYHYDIAKSYDLPFISYRNAILDVINKEYIKWTDISDDNIHPNTVGHKVLSQIITHYLDKVNSEKDTVDGAESDFSTAYTSDKYSNAVTLTPNEIDAVDETGTFTANKDATWSNMPGYWMARKKGGFEGAKLVFKDVEAKNIGVIYGRLTATATILDIYIDGVLAKSIDARFPNGWGNYAEAEFVASFEESAKHTIEIVPRDEDDASMVYISGLLIS